MVGLVPARADGERIVQFLVVPLFVGEGLQHFQSAAGVCILREIFGGVVPLSAQAVELVRLRAEYIVVFPARALENFDVRAVHGAAGDGSVHHELHVARAARLQPRRRNLQRYVAARDDFFRIADAVVGDEYDLQFLVDLAVRGDHRGDVVDEFDDALGAEVGGRALCPEQEHARRKTGQFAPL